MNFNDPTGLRRGALEGAWDAVKGFWNNLGKGEEVPVGADIPDHSPRVIGGSTPSFRNRWEEDEFFGRPCSEVAPEAPEGADIDANIAEAQAKLREFVALASKAPGAVDVNVLIGAWFAEKVKTGGEWDYKTRYDDSKWAEFGNYNFGAVGAAIGYTGAILLRAAGGCPKRDA